jgi:hypothetical protein
MTARLHTACAIFAAMAARQLWMFLTDADVTRFLETLEAREPGLVASGGRYLRGDPRALLDNPASLERRESMPGERRVYLLHRKHSQDVVAHVQPGGPFEGWSQIDEERTDCLILRLQDAPPGKLQPARLYGSTSFWRGAVKTRKRPMFAFWANATLRALSKELPSTATALMRIGPDALARALAKELTLTYLFRPIAPVKDPA